MSDRDVQNVVRSVEQAPTSRDGHIHNFQDTYRQIVQMQQNDGGAHSAEFRRDMDKVNNELHRRGLITNLQILGADENHHTLLTRDRADRRDIVQNPAYVNDQGALGSGMSAREAQDAVRARAMGLDVTRNPDGSYDVHGHRENPQARHPQAMAPNADANAILGRILQGLTGQGGQERLPPGMNPWTAQAWRGWERNR